MASTQEEKNIMTNFKNALTLEQLKLEFTTGIGESVIEELESHGDDWEAHLNNIISYGCVSGVVNSLIYYGDTTEFHDENEVEIDEIIADFLQSTGMTFEQLTNNKFELYEIMELKNFKSWFAFDYVASQINDYLENI